MATFMSLAILVTPYLLVRFFAAQHDRTSDPVDPAPKGTRPRRATGTGTGSQEELAWSALDDRQLTRLLINSAPRTSSE